MKVTFFTEGNKELVRFEGFNGKDVLIREATEADKLRHGGAPGEAPPEEVGPESPPLTAVGLQPLSLAPELAPVVEEKPKKKKGFFSKE